MEFLLREQRQQLRKVEPSEQKFVESFSEEDNSPTQLHDGLFIGSIKCANNHSALQAVGITHILTLCCEREPLRTPEFHYHSVPFFDKATVDLSPILPECIDFIDSARKNGGRVLVHCLQGVSRSGAICIAYIMKENKSPFQITWQQTRQLRRVIHPNESFKRQLKSFEAQLEIKQ
jgi:protein-tyrosine phosphatase